MAKTNLLRTFHSHIKGANVTDLATENRLIKVELDRLRDEVAALKKKLEYLDKHTALAKGMRGESLVASWVNGVITTHNASHDVALNGRNVKLEIKYAGLNVAVRGRQADGRETLRWAWSKPFGESGNKVYDQLILLGDKDPRYLNQYKGVGCPYIFFDVPFSEIMPLTIQTNSGRYRSIQLTSNPRSSKSAGSLLFRAYQITTEELNQRYGL